MPFERLLLYLLLMSYPIGYVSGFCHELGHAVMAWLMGIRVTAFGLGTGRPFFLYKWGEIRIYFGLERPLQGLAHIYPQQILLSRRQAVGSFLGGVFAHLVLALLGLGLWLFLPWLSFLWIELAVLNVLYAFLSLLPFSFQIGTYRAATDGASVLYFLRTGVVDSPAPVHLGVYKLLHRLLEQIGDRLGCLLLLQASAWDCCEMGVMDRANELSRK